MSGRYVERGERDSERNNRYFLWQIAATTMATLTVVSCRHIDSP